MLHDQHASKSSNQANRPRIKRRPQHDHLGLQKPAFSVPPAVRCAGHDVLQCRQSASSEGELTMAVTNYLWDVENDSYLAETDGSDSTTAVYTNEPDHY